MTTIFLPTYGRPQVIARVVQNIHETTSGDYRILFIVEPEDTASQEAIQATGEQFLINTGRASCASCINCAYHATDDPYFFIGADDLTFYPEWLTIALARMGNGIQVVGTNDLYNPQVVAGETATHFLVARAYIQEQSGVVDQPDTVLYDYSHNYCDTEFIDTAKARGVFVSEPLSIVEHKHWSFGLAPMDATYQRGMQENAHDMQMFLTRKHLWEALYEEKTL
jgi:Glycosyl transferase family 2